MHPLSTSDIKQLRYQCRMGYIIPSFIFLLIIPFIAAIFENVYDANYSFATMAWALVLIFSALFAFGISYLMNRKYYADIKGKVKMHHTKQLDRKVAKKDFEAGSGNVTTLPHNRTMNEFIRYDFIIDNTYYRVDKNLFEVCNNGDKVLFYYAPNSQYILGIEKA